MLRRSINIISIIAFLAIASTASALTFNFNTQLNNAKPSGSSPWLTATFTDVTGGVQLYLESKLKDQNEFFGAILFNFNPSLDPTKLNFTNQGGYIFNSVEVGTNNQAIGQGNLGLFDLETTPYTTGNSDRFNNSDTSTYLITSTQTFNSLDFQYFSTGGSIQDVYAAAHVQGVNGIGYNSAKIYATTENTPPPPPPPPSVPEPGTIVLLGAGLLGLGVYGRKRIRK